ncbi:hypothetical protein APASM_1875 [Actinosynnema pretiosum subsp. pretiosum]|nr:hypothetical protein APASM_1875 [Actinosynnema pretiosum subsp. pretiosum]
MKRMRARRVNPFWKALSQRAGAGPCRGEVAFSEVERDRNLPT